MSHAEERLLFPENREPYLSIDRTPISNGELYTIIIYREAHGGIRSIVAIVKETKTMSSLLWDKSPEEELQKAPKGNLTCRTACVKLPAGALRQPVRVIDRFHIQKLACDTVQEIRIGHRRGVRYWEAFSWAPHWGDQACKSGIHTF